MPGGKREKHIPTDETRALVEQLSGMGTRHEDIAAYLGFGSKMTLYKYYKEELNLGAVKANTTIAQTLYQQAKDGNTTACMFWLKTRAGWRETQKLEVDSNVKAELSGKITLADLMLEDYAKKGKKSNG